MSSHFPPPSDPLLRQPNRPVPPPGGRPDRTDRPARPARKGKPARGAKLTALTMSAVSTVALAGLFAQQDGQVDSVELTVGTAAAPTTVETPTTAAGGAADATTTTEAATSSSVDSSSVTIADGTYAGVPDSNRWGTVQVQVVYSGGVLTDVQILQYPDGDRKSVRINENALPTLISEALSMQSADVSTVSGATYTSDSYQYSLQSAIDAATTASGLG